MNANADHALVLFSGGQDSTICLALALARHPHVETIGFRYGQRHAVELACRPVIREKLAGLGFPGRLGADHVIDLGPAMAAVGETALTGNAAIALGADGLPNTFVPGRNLLFLTLAARRDLRRLIGGMCETDYSGYPDCRDDTIKAMQVALNLGMARRFVLETPLMWLSKAESWHLAKDLGGEALVALIIEETHTCYLGARGARHDWGHGCGTCPACVLREAGYRAFRGG